MSNMIHNGYRLAEGTNPFEFARRVRAVMDPIRDRADGALLAMLCASAVDRLWVSGRPIGPILAFTALSEWEEQQKALDKDSRAHDPNGFEMCLGEDPETGRILARIYTQRTEMAQAFRSLPEVEPYLYWNNYDAPGGLTEEEWAEREAAWARVMPDYAPPAEHMLSFVLRTEANPGTLMLCSMNGGATDPVLNRFPDRAARARTAAGPAYARYLADSGVDTEAALRGALVPAGRLAPIADVLERLLPELTRDLLLEGTAGMCPDPALLEQVRAACAAVHEADRASQAG